MSVLSDYERDTAPLPGRPQALTLRTYSDSEVFDLEMDRVFRRDWIGVCGTDELPDSGNYYAFAVAGEPIVVIRGADGMLRCFSNVCRHRGTVLYDEGRGSASSIQCPYHAWTYDNSGRLPFRNECLHREWRIEMENSELLQTMLALMEPT